MNSTVDHDPSRPPPRARLCAQVRIKDLVERVVPCLEAHETINAFTRRAVRNELARRAAAINEELRALDDADWSLLVSPGAEVLS